MNLLLPWVFLGVITLGRASRGSVAPQGNRCPASPLCDLVGNWTSLTGNVRVLAWREGGLLGVKHLTRSLLLHGAARLAAGSSRTAFASVVVGSRTTPSLCLQLVLACFRNTLWVTELSMVGSVPAVTYPLQRLTTSPTARAASRSTSGCPRACPRACPKDCSSKEDTLGIAHNVLVNITLYHNLTADDVAHDVVGSEAAEDAVDHKTVTQVATEDDKDDKEDVDAFEDSALGNEAIDDLPIGVENVPEEEGDVRELEEACDELWADFSSLSD